LSAEARHVGRRQAAAKGAMTEFCHSWIINRDYAGEDPDGDDQATFNVFFRSGSAVRHVWGDEMSLQTADPGQDPRGAPDLMPLWTVLDMTPGGRGTDWYPRLEYGIPPVARVLRTQPR